MSLMFDFYCFCRKNCGLLRYVAFDSAASNRPSADRLPHIQAVADPSDHQVHVLERAPDGGLAMAEYRVAVGNTVVGAKAGEEL